MNCGEQLRCAFAIVSANRDRIVIRDLGPWNRFVTVTNDAAAVVAFLAPALRGRRLFYFDSGNRLDEIVVRAGVFVGFAPADASRLELEADNLARLLEAPAE